MSEERLNSVKEVAEYLNVSVKTIRRKVQDKGIPHVYINKHAKFDKQLIDKWLLKRTFK